MATDSLEAGASNGEIPCAAAKPHAPAQAVWCSEATGTPLTVIGEIIADEEVLLVDADGSERSLGKGFDHFAAPSQGRGCGDRAAE